MPTPFDPAVALLRVRGAAGVEHPGGDLLSHLVRTEEILGGWGAPAAVARAGLLHAVYGTSALPTSLLALKDRATVRELIGDEAEAIVYRYGACDRAATYPGLGGATVAFTDRFTGAVEEIGGAEMEAFALLTVANELDVVRAGALGPDVVAEIASLVERLALYAPEAAARALAEIRPAG